MTPYYLIYLLVCCGLPIIAIDNVRTRHAVQRYYFFLLAAVLTVFVGSRTPTVDVDYANYSLWFQAIASGAAGPAELFRDPAFALISVVVARLGFSYSAVATVYALLASAATIYFATLVIDNRWVMLFVYLFFCEYFVVAQLTEIRSAVAIPLMASSVYLACEEQKLKSLLLFVIALIFHFSAIAILALLILIYSGVRFRSRLWIVALVPLGFIIHREMEGVVASLSNMYRLSEFLTGSAEENTVSYISFFSLAHIVSIGFVLIFLWNKLSLYQRIATLCASLGFFVFVTFIWNTGIATRFQYLFDGFWLVTLMILLDLWKGPKRLMYAAFLILFGLGLFYKSFWSIAPYSSLLTGRW